MPNPIATGLSRMGGSYSDEIEEAFEEARGSHECSVCGSRKDVQDYQKETPSWCEHCESVKTFRKVDDE